MSKVVKVIHDTIMASIKPLVESRITNVLYHDLKSSFVSTISRRLIMQFSKK